MKLLKVNDRLGNDWWVDLECRHCGAVQKNVVAYNDTNYWINVMPNIACPECDKKELNKLEKDKQ